LIWRRCVYCQAERCAAVERSARVVVCSAANARQPGGGLDDAWHVARQQGGQQTCTCVSAAGSILCMQHGWARFSWRHGLEAYSPRAFKVLAVAVSRRCGRCVLMCTCWTRVATWWTCAAWLRLLRCWALGSLRWRWTSQQGRGRHRSSCTPQR
jgi:hypothetical protein